MKNISLNILAVVCAVTVPYYYLVAYSPYGMDTTDFGYFYAYAWRIIQGEIPYKDFIYIKPAFPLYWHAFWLAITPLRWQILAGKMAFCLSILLSSWCGTLYLAKLFDFRKLNVPVPLMATVAFVFGIHCFPHMPWHTADGVLFCTAALLATVSGCGTFGGLCAAAATLCKQSFALVPVAILLFLLVSKRPRRAFLVAFCLAIAAWCFWLYAHDAWQPFLAQTSGQLDIREALDAGILIYLRQNWLLPFGACIPLISCRIMHKSCPPLLTPAFCYLLLLTIAMLYLVNLEKTWIGFGLSWPTLFMILGATCVLFPNYFLKPFLSNGYDGNSALIQSVGLAAALVCAWSVAISGGYKIPAFFAAPLLFCFFLWHTRFFGSALPLCWATLAAGLIIFGWAWHYPYTFPSRPLVKNELVHDAGAIYPQANRVKVDIDMLERLQELKDLRAKYGPIYKTLPGFSFAYYLNGDKPVIASDWLIDWEINGQVQQLYQELMEKNVTVFMERDQLDAAKADAYDRAAYGVPQLVRHLWRVVEETPHFVVFQPPLSAPK